MGVWSPGPSPTSGKDTFIGDASNEFASGLGGDDTLIGNGGNDTLDGGDGADTLIGGFGADSLIGGSNLSGLDFASYGTASSGVVADLTLGGSAGEAAGDSYNGIEALSGSAYNDTLRGDGAQNALYGNEGDDVLFGGDARDILDGAQGDDFMIGGAGNDQMNGDIGFDTVSYEDSPTGLVATIFPDSGLRTGYAASDHLVSVERLVGSAYDDTLYADNGSEFLVGGSGNDTLIGIAGADTLDGGEGMDVASYYNALVGLTASLFASGLNTGDASGDAYLSIEGLHGSAFDDFLSGDGASNLLDGDDGDDTLDGGLGADTMSGGVGDDGYIVDNAGDVVSENDGEGADTIQSGIALTLGANVENLILTGSSDTNGAGNELNNTLTGNAGANTLDGGDGNDTLNGGLGVDAIHGGAGDDTVLYALGDGNGAMDGGDGADTLNLSDGAAGGILNATWNGAALTVLAGNTLVSIESINANLGGGVDWLIYGAADAVTVNFAVGTASGFTSIAGIERVIGGSGNDVITGDGADNRLDGGVGDDTLAGGGGIDTLIGGDGADVISGGLGNDSIQAGAGNDTINWALGENRDTIDGGADSDTFNAAGSGGADLGNVTWNGTALTAVMDNGLANIEAVNLNLAGGVDWLIYNATAAVVVNLSTGSASGFASVANIEKVIGGAGDDTLTGDTLDNRLDGLAGADTLDGGAGSDAVLGGDGNDTIYASAGNDSLQGQNGADTFIWTSTDGRDTFNGGADTDTVNLTGSAVADVADTNWNGSVITGLLNNALVDIETVNLDLGAGGAGGDWLRYNTALGIAVDLGAGTATGFASITGVENLIGGTGGDSLTGDGGVNKINGNAGDDVITGGGGNDNLTGGAGNDTFVYAAGAGNDTIIDFDAWDVGGQDFLDVSAFGINAGNFAARVAIIDTGADTVVRIDNTYFITLKNVSGDGDNVITDADFIFGP